MFHIHIYLQLKPYSFYVCKLKKYIEAVLYSSLIRCWSSENGDKPMTADLYTCVDICDDILL